MQQHFDRRTFIRDFGRGVLGITVGGVLIGACGGDDASTTTAGTVGSSTTTGATSAATTGATAATTSTTVASTTSVADTAALEVRQVSLGFVAAYVMVRGSEAAIVDTGQGGAASDIEAALAEAGLGWGSVGDLVLTHRHNDHVGALSSVAAAATDATIAAGEADLSGISVPGRSIEPLTDGQQVFGSTIIASPGHTAGHICVWDQETAVLIAGDALVGGGTPFPSTDGVGGSPPDFTADATAAAESVKKLAALMPDTIWFGHGAPLIGGASTPLSALAASV